MRMDVLMNQRRLRLELMNWQLQLNHQYNVNNMLMVIRVAEEHRRVQQRRRCRRIWWVRPWIGRRLKLCQYSRLLELQLRLEDVPVFRNFLRMEPELFVEILNHVRDSIWRQDTFYRRALDPGLKLALTLRYLASGDSSPSCTRSECPCAQ